MSGLEIIGCILGAYPVLTKIAATYKGMKPGQGTRISRKLEMEATIYDKIVKDLLASVVSQEDIRILVSQDVLDELVKDKPPAEGPWQEQSLKQKLRIRLGGGKLKNTLSCLSEMEVMMDDLKAELENMNRGTRVLDKFKTKVKTGMATLPGSVMQERLKRLEQMNIDLKRLLDETPVVTPLSHSSGGNAVELNFSHEDRIGDVQEFYETIRQLWNCSCATGHVANLGCHCDACVKPFTLLQSTPETQEWKFGLAIPKRKDSLSSPQCLSAIVVLEPPGGGNDEDERPTIRDLCSLVQEVDKGPQAPPELMDIVGHNKTYKLQVKKIEGSRFGDMRCLADLLGSDKHLPTGDRLELAFRLSSAILQLWKTPWIDEKWTWNDVCVSQVVEEDRLNVKFNILFIPREFYSVNHPGDTASARTVVNDTPFSISTEHPVLAKLGFALIELALGQTLEQMQEETKSLMGFEDRYFDDDSINLWTAKRLLKSNEIRREAGKQYEDVVKACINCQYWDRDGTRREFRLGDDSFLPSVREAIIKPLFWIWKRYI